MKIISFSLDNSSLDKKSVLANRLIDYGSLVERYEVIAPSFRFEKIELSDKVVCYGSGGANKLSQFYKIYKLGKKILAREKYDVITVQDLYYLALIALSLSKKFKIGLEVQVHGLEKYYGIRKLIAKYVLARANAVRCVSQRLKRSLQSDFGVVEEKITVVPIYSELRITNYPPSPRLPPTLALWRTSRGTSELRINEDTKKFIFLTVGRLVPVKNIGLQIEAMAEIVKKYPEAELWIIGGGEEENNLKNKIKSLKLNDQVKLLGRQADLARYYSQADAFVLTSNAEGWGLAVIEAAAAGLAIIMTEVGCAGEVIKNGDSGLVISTGNKRKLVEAMLKIIEDGNLRKKLGAKAKLALNQLPDKEQTLKLYKKSWELAATSKMSARGGSPPKADQPLAGATISGGKILILTQKVDINDDLLGFTHDWLLEFAKQCDQLTVICLEKGADHLPANVKVLSLGKESGRSRLKYVFNFYKYIWRERNNYDAVLAHMNAEYVILGGIVWRLLKKKIALWYVHRQVSFKLKLAEKLVNLVFTASRESFRLKSAKLKIIGHGINLNRFYRSPEARDDKNFKIIYVGRISRIKNQKLLLEAMNILVNPVKSGSAGAKLFNGVNKNNLKNLKVSLVGGPVYEKDRIYLNELIDLVKKNRLENYVEFIGGVPNKDMARVYRQADLSVNLCPTGGLDKAVLESMAAGLPVIVFNKSFAELLADYKEDLILSEETAECLAEKISRLRQVPKNEIEIMTGALKAKIAENYNLVSLIKRIIHEMEKIA